MVSKLTKQLVHMQVSGMKSRYLKLKGDRDALLEDAKEILVQMVALKVQYEALIKDIPEPPVAGE